MRSFAPILRIAMASLLVGTAYGDSGPEAMPVPVDVTAEAVVTTTAPVATADDASVEVESVSVVVDDSKAKPIVLSETRVEALSPEASAARSASAARTNTPAPGGFHNANKADPAVLHYQEISGYRVNTVRLLLPAEMKVTVRKDWYGKRIKLTYPRNPYSTWRGVSPDAFRFRHDGVVMEVVPSGSRYVPETVQIEVPHSVTIERR